jgi:hypothetical protein
MERCPLTKVDLEVSSAGYVRKSFELALNDELAHCQHGFPVLFV